MSTTRVREVRLSFRSDVEAPAVGRQALHDVLVETPTRTVQDAQLLLTEVMTNAIRHAGLGSEDAISVLIRVSDRSVEVEVSNRGPSFDPRSAPPRSRGTGWGLLLLDRIAEDWGVRPAGANEVGVWFRLGLEDV
jgi:serine/threonine-protein kinase RsbW